VPKLSLVSRLQALLHEGSLKIHRDIPDAAVLVRELRDFRVEFTAAGSLTFNARSGWHDDLVLALAIAVWVAHGGWMASAGIYEYYRNLAGAGLPEREVIGVDLGQARDPTAICVVRRVDVAVGIPPPEPDPEAEPAPAVRYAEAAWNGPVSRRPRDRRRSRKRTMAGEVSEPLPGGIRLMRRSGWPSSITMATRSGAASPARTRRSRRCA
jgi:hypothetical protein